MDSGALLDLLGNENRRRILRLLARKPCYVTEISDHLGVSPKAVIDHLRKLEEAGLVESRTDDQRRKYFSIARNVRLEVTVSPYGFGTKSAYPANRSLDVTAWRHLSIEVGDEGTVGDGDDASAAGSADGGSADGGSVDGDDPAALASRLGSLDELEAELSVAQRWVQGRMTEVLDRLTDVLEVDGEARLYAEVLAGVAAGADTAAALGRRVGAPEPVVEEALSVLAERGHVRRTPRGWRLAD